MTSHPSEAAEPPTPRQRPITSTTRIPEWEARFAPGALLQDRFTIEGVLGEGGMGRVLLAFDEQLQRQVALKILPPEVADDEGRARFLREAHALARIHHPNVVGVFTSGLDEDVAWMALEYVDGDPLSDLLDGGPLDEATALEACAQAARGLAAVHAQGVVHRDVKPENLLIDAEGTVRVVDFGIALLEGPQKGGFVTQKGVAIGTPHFMSPEQAKGALVDEAADAWGIGATLYQLLSGQPPFYVDDDDADVEILARVLQDDVPALEERVPLHLGTADLLRRLLSKDKAVRGDDLDAIADDIDDVLASLADHTAVPAMPASAAEVPVATEPQVHDVDTAGSTPRRSLRVGALVVVLLAAFGVWQLAQQRDDVLRPPAASPQTTTSSSTAEGSLKPSVPSTATPTKALKAAVVPPEPTKPPEPATASSADLSTTSPGVPDALRALTPDELVRRARSGEVDAVDDLLRFEHPGVPAAVRDLLDDSADAEKIMLRVALSKRRDRVALLRHVVFGDRPELAAPAIRLLQNKVRNVASIQLLDEIAQKHSDPSIRKQAKAARQSVFSVEGEDGTTASDGGG